MSVDPKSTPLFAYLKRKHDVYAGKVLELRDAVRGWLEYIPATFPHYTSHTVGHSDEIVSQLSRLLFRTEKGRRPVIDLSATEAYILVACAYLHDAGMVVSDRAKAEIRDSDAWRDWTTGEGGGAKRWRDVEALRARAGPSDADLHFAADVQTRFLLAEFVRRTHHLRAADVMTQHQARLGRFAFDDAMLLSTITRVCVAHGLRPNELEDRERYPERCDIRGDPVNVRLMAILLRLGDLLDMSSDRACPLLLSAACPLPADSFAHWTQYQRITHRMTATKRIEVRAECQTQEEHRTLRDWCQWLVDEVAEARRLMATAEWHADWRPPQATLDGAQPTIVIRPAQGATYVPLDWRFELDAEAVLERLIHDVHDQPEAFIRELIQNALDANRCQMYADLKADGMTPPEYPTQVDEDRRRRYPVRLTLRTKQVKNDLSGQTEERQVLTVEDCGIGMDRDIIERYFLQVARSYYLTEEFRRTYGFVPTSRFGVGFLSVFAVSDHITVDTYKPTSPAQDGPLCLTLTGPRNYLLTDKGERQAIGTAIEVVLRQPLQARKLTKLVSGWCRRVEFPVLVDEMGQQTTVEAERWEDFTFEVPDVEEPGAAFHLRALPVDLPGIEGEIYVLARTDKAGEDWTVGRWELERYAERHPHVRVPPLPSSVSCLHGITAYSRSQTDVPAARLDFRASVTRTPLDRRLVRGPGTPSDVEPFGPQMGPRLEGMLKGHLAESPRANSEDAWKYRQDLMKSFHFDSLWSFWASMPETIRTYQGGQARLVSLEELRVVPLLTCICAGWRTAAQGDQSLDEIRGPCVTEEDVDRIWGKHRDALFEGRSVASVRWLSGGHLAVDWATALPDEVLMAPVELGSDRPCQFLMLADPAVVAVEIHPTDDYSYRGFVLVNTGHPWGEWLQRMREAAAAGRHGWDRRRVDGLVGLLTQSAHQVEHIGFFGWSEMADFNTRVKGWRDFPGLPPELHPPEIELTSDMFLLRAAGRS